MQNESNAPEQALPTSSFPLAPLFGVTLAVTMIVAIGVYAVRSYSLRAGVGGCYECEGGEEQPPMPHAKWPKPLVAIVLSGQMHGYYDPCGCSYPQHGGLTRRYNFIQSLKAKQWDV